MESKRTLVMVIDSYGDVARQLLLTEDQVKLLEWLQAEGYMDGGDDMFQILPDEQHPEVI
ncbi:MAG: hypothetical protein K2N48_07310 [Muribaculaceae bacterium]|nr:hypothetical protein [Muribaculaceae bacterium]